MPDPDDTVTLILPAATPFPTVAGQWNRLPNGELRATFTLTELHLAFTVCKALAEPRLPSLPPLPPHPADAVLHRYAQFGDKWLLRIL